VIDIQIYDKKKPFKNEGAAKKIKIRAYSPSQLVGKKRKIYTFEDRFKKAFGCPETHAKWFFTGPSFAGKSSLLFDLCAYLTRFGVVDYNNFEEAGGDSETVVQKLRMFNLTETDGRFRLFKAPIVSDSHETLTDRLNRRNSAAFAVIDSVQHAEITKRTYIDLTDRFCNNKKGKSLLFVSHWVKNDLTKFIRHDCDIKVEVVNFVARVESRYGGNTPLVIWEERARQLWGKKFKQVTEGRYWPGQKK
jgi:hypothetical protein